jgi:hypothetical protein
MYLNIESIINNLPIKKAPCPNSFSGSFYQTSRKEIISVLYNLFKRQNHRECSIMNSVRSPLA